MINTAETFVQSVFTFYTFYKFIHQQSKVYKISSLAYLQWEIFNVVYTLLVIYMSSVVTSEVCVTCIKFYYQIVTIICISCMIRID